MFLSHATADTAYVELVKTQMEALGVSVYLAENDPKPGVVLASKVEEAIERSHVVVVLITTTSVASTYVNQEVGMARTYQKPIVPIVEKGIDTRRMGVLQGLEHLELDPERPAEAMANMTAALQPLVLKQIPVNVSMVTVNQTSIDFPTALLLVGLGLLLGALIYASLSSGGGQSA